MKDVYMPINTYHYQAFPFKSAIVYGNLNETESDMASNESNAEENSLEMAAFH